jgi:hypothetical protein
LELLGNLKVTLEARTDITYGTLRERTRGSGFNYAVITFVFGTTSDCQARRRAAG